jgi:hypothetical protein
MARRRAAVTRAAAEQAPEGYPAPNAEANRRPRRSPSGASAASGAAETFWDDLPPLGATVNPGGITATNEKYAAALMRIGDLESQLEIAELTADAIREMVLDVERGLWSWDELLAEVRSVPASSGAAHTGAGT